MQEFENLGKKLLEYEKVMKLARDIQKADPGKDFLDCRKEAYQQLKSEGKLTYI